MPGNKFKDCQGPMLFTRTFQVMKRQKIQGLSRTWWTPCGRSGEAQWALPAGFGRSPENPKVFHYFHHSGCHSGWPLLTLNVDHHAAIGGQDPLDPLAYAPVFSSGTEGIRSCVRSSTRERNDSQLRRRARNPVLRGLTYVWHSPYRLVKEQQ